LTLPNYLSILTGVPPELHGSIGDDYKQVNLDTIYNRVSEGGKIGAVISSNRLADIVKRPVGFEYFVVDDSIQVEGMDKPNQRHIQMRGFDSLIAKQTQDAIVDPRNYNLITSYFANVDAASHSYGARSDSSQFIQALEEQAVYLKALIDTVGDDTIVIITSDHGNVKAGGHGGSGSAVTDIPLWIYRRASNATNIKMINNTPQFYLDEDMPTSLDISTLITSYLGLSPPTSSMGKIPKDALFLSADLLNGEPTQSTVIQYYAIVSQRKAAAEALMKSWEETVNYNNLIRMVLPEPLTNPNIEDIVPQLQVYVDKLKIIDQLYSSDRNTVFRKDSSKNAFLGIGISFVVGLICVFVVVFTETKHGVHVPAKELFSLVKLGVFAFAVVMGGSLAIFRIMMLLFRNPDNSEWIWDLTIVNSSYDVGIIIGVLSGSSILLTIICFQSVDLYLKAKRNFINSGMSIFSSTFSSCFVISATVISTCFSTILSVNIESTEAQLSNRFRCICVVFIVIPALFLGTIYFLVFSFSYLLQDNDFEDTELNQIRPMSFKERELITQRPRSLQNFSRRPSDSDSETYLPWQTKARPSSVHLGQQLNLPYERRDSGQFSRPKTTNLLQAKTNNIQIFSKPKPISPNDIALNKAQSPPPQEQTPSDALFEIQINRERERLARFHPTSQGHLTEDIESYEKKLMEENKSLERLRVPVSTIHQPHRSDLVLQKNAQVIDNLTLEPPRMIKKRPKSTDSGVLARQIKSNASRENPVTNRYSQEYVKPTDSVKASETLSAEEISSAVAFEIYKKALEREAEILYKQAGL
jgi:hypothetical protein